MIRFERVRGNPEVHLPEFARLCRRDVRVEAAYLGGSYGRGDPLPLSDVDIGILLRADIDPRRYFAIQLELLNALMRLFRTGEVDLLLINRASVSVVHRFIADGRLVFERSHPRRVDFEVRITQRRLDMKFFDRIYLTSLKRDLGRGGLLGTA